MAYTLTLTGNTYGIKETLKGLKFRWDSFSKAWKATLETKEEAEELAHRWVKEGVYGTIKQKVDKRYMVKESWIFNLESMHDKIWCLIFDVQNKEIECPFTVAGKTINDEGDLYELMNEADTLCCAAKRSKGVTGKEYGRIKEIVAWRVEARYARCMASGMDEAEAGKCFEDM